MDFNKIAHISHILDRTLTDEERELLALLILDELKVLKNER